MKKILLAWLFVLLVNPCIYGEGFYGSPVTVDSKTIKLDFNIVFNYIKSGDIKKAVELYSRIAEEKKEEDEKLINELSYNILCKLVLDENQHRDIRTEAAQVLSKYYGEKALDVFSKAIKTNNYVVKMGIIKALGNIKTEKSFKLIAPNVNDDADNIKITAIEALGELGGPKSEKVLKKTLKSKDYFTKLSAALSLFKIGNKDGMDLIKKEGIKEPVDRWRVKVVQTLAKKKDSSVIGLLKEALKDNNKAIRNIAMEGLIGNESRSIEYIFKDLLKMKEKYVQVKSAEYLLKRGDNDVIPLLTAFLSDKNETIKIMAASVLIGLGNNQAIEVFKDVINSKSEYARRLALDNLVKLPASSHLVKLVLLAYRSDDYYVRAKAVEALGKMKSRMYFYEIKKAMYDSHSFVRMTASSILALKGEEEGVQSIIDFLNWGNDELRMFSIEVMSKIDSNKYLPLIRKIAFTDKNWSVGMKALEILVGILNKGSKS